MEHYTSLLSAVQKSLLGAVERGTFADVKILLKKVPDILGDETFSYVLLVAALHRGHKSITTLLLQSGCSASNSIQTNHYCTPLYYAVQSNDINMFKQLLKKEASMNARDANSITPLELAMLAEEPKFIDFILFHQEYDDINPIEHMALFHLASYRGNIAVMKRFLKCNFSVNSKSNNYFESEEWAGGTALHFALKGRWERSEAVSLLLERDVDFDVQDNRGNTALMLAVQELDRDADIDLMNRIFVAYVRLFNFKNVENPVNKCGLSHMHILSSIAWDDDKNGRDLTKLLKILKYFMSKKVDINSANYLPKDFGEFYYAGYTALHWAASESCLEILKLLLQKGAKPKKLDARGNTPLHVLDFGNVKGLRMAELLLNYGADADLENYQHCTPLHCAFYAQKENQSLIQLLLCRSQSTVNKTDSYGLSYLHIAASTGDLRKVEIFVNNGAPVNSYIDSETGGSYGYSALHFAVIFNNVEIVEYLLAQGAEVNTSMLEGKSAPLSPLLLACTEQIKCLLESCDADVEKSDQLPSQTNGIPQIELDDFDWNLSRSNQNRIIELLLEHGALVNTEDSMKMTPLSKACEIPSSVSKKSYIYRGGQKKFILDEIITRKKMMIEILLRYGADANHRGDGGRSLLHILFERSDKCSEIKDLAEILLKGGANVDIVDDDGLSPLHLAVKNSSCDRFGKVLFKRDSSFVDLFLEYGADVNSKSSDLSTPLHSAVKCYHADPDRKKIFTKLLDHRDIDIDAQDYHGDTPLHVAIRLRKFFCIENLLNAGAQMNVKNVDGHTPISLFLDWLKMHIVKGTRQLEDCFQRNECKIHKTIITHMKKLKSLNYILSSKENLCFLELSEYNTKNDSAIDTMIDQEISRLKSVKMDDSLSLWEILLNDSKDLEEHTRNKLSEKLTTGQFQKEFSLFFSFLKNKLKRTSTKNSNQNGLGLTNLVKSAPPQKICRKFIQDSSVIEGPQTKLSRLH